MYVKNTHKIVASFLKRDTFQQNNFDKTLT